MPEFNCAQCHRLIRTPQGTEGQQGKCPHCGHLMPIPVGSTSSTFGAPSPYQSPAPTIDPPPDNFYSGSGNPHRGETIAGLGMASLVTGIASIVATIGGFILPFPCCVASPLMGLLAIGLGIPAWLMGTTDLQLLHQGAMDPAGLPNTKNGRMLGIIGFSLGVVTFLLIALLIGVAMIYASQQQ